MSLPHDPIFVTEILQALDGQELSVFVDGTLGAGGHARAILEAHPELQRYIGIDQDPDARALATERLGDHAQRLTVVAGNFRKMDQHLQGLEIESVDGILLDLGVSSMQLDRPERGFSFREAGPLDMRMDPTRSLTAEQIVNEWEEGEIIQILKAYGEIREAKRVARAVVQARPLQDTKQLADVIAGVIRQRPGKRVHPATQVFQAIRIAVNEELTVVQEGLEAALRVLRPGGILCVISFHSLEDRIAKRFFQKAASDKWDTAGQGGVFLDKTPEIRILNRKPLVPTDEEQQRNPRSRSAKLRCIEKL